LKHLSWIITLPITVLVLVFVLSNRQPVQLDFWPLEMTMTAPLYLLMALTLLFGFFLGGIAMWVTAGRSRRRAREAAAKLREAEGQIVSLKRDLDRKKPANDPANAARVAPAAAQARLTSAQG
jgi:uncharacterized integral membrane protein